MQLQLILLHSIVSYNSPPVLQTTSKAAQLHALLACVTFRPIWLQLVNSVDQSIDVSITHTNRSMADFVILLDWCMSYKWLQGLQLIPKAQQIMQLHITIAFRLVWMQTDKSVDQSIDVINSHTNRSTPHFVILNEPFVSYKWATGPKSTSKAVKNAKFLESIDIPHIWWLSQKSVNGSADVLHLSHKRPIPLQTQLQLAFLRLQVGSRPASWMESCTNTYISRFDCYPAYQVAICKLDY